MNPPGRGNHRVLQKPIRYSVWSSFNDAAPFPKARRIHREDLIRGGQLIHPTLDLVRLRRILKSDPLNPGLQFAQSYGGKEQLLLLLLVEPSDHGTMRTRSSEFGHDVGIQKVLVHSNSTTARRRTTRRSPIMSSKRGSGASNKSLRLGRAAFWSFSHSSIRTRTAAFTPRRVTT